MTHRTWYRFENNAQTPTVADIYVYDLIGRSWWSDDTVAAKQFIDELKALAADVRTIRVHVNSPGGDVFEAVAITNALRAQREEKGRTVEMLVEGLAASAASFLLQAGNTIRIADNALVMVHNPWSIQIGEASDMLEMAAMLEKVRDTIIATYRWHSTLSVDELKALMDAETWLTADEAIEKGFATEKVEGLRAAACFGAPSLRAIKVPAQFADQVQAFAQQAQQRDAAPSPAPAEEVLARCQRADCLDLAAALVAEKATLEQVDARISSAQAAKAEAQARREAITGMCASQRLPALADSLVASGMTVDQVRAHLTVVTAALDRIEIDGGLRPDAGPEAVTASWKEAHKRASGRRR